MREVFDYSGEQSSLMRMNFTLLTSRDFPRTKRCWSPPWRGTGPKESESSLVLALGVGLGVGVEWPLRV